MIDVDTEITSASRCDQKDTIIMIIRLLCNKLSIITNKGGILVWRLWGAGGCPGNPSSNRLGPKAEISLLNDFT
jgi:hypothetical protein